MRFLLTSLFVLFLGTCTSAMLGINQTSGLRAQCPIGNQPADYAALESFYNAANGDDWTVNTNWLSDCDVCGWFGVTCDANDRVTEIVLPSNNLTGELSPMTGTIERLSRLDVRSNMISGVLPSLIWEPPLVSINLSNNDFFGQVPDAGNMPFLEFVNLGGNGFSVSNLPIITEAPNLTIFNASNAGFVDNIPDTYNPTEMPALTRLDLSDNNIFDELPPELGEFTNLNFLNLRNNNFIGCYPISYSSLCSATTNFQGNASLPDGGGISFFSDSFCGDELTCEPSCHPDYPALAALYNATDGDNWTDNTNWMADCNVCDWVGIVCDANDRVRRLELPDNNLVGTIPSEITQLSEVEFLRFNNNDFQGSSVPDLTGLGSLQRLRLHRTNLAGSLPALGNMPDLTDLSLYDNAFTGPIPVDYSSSSLPSLARFYIDRNQLNGPLPATLTDFTDLAEFNAHTNNFSGCYPESYDQLCGLSSIQFYNNPDLPDGGSTDFFQNDFCTDGTLCEPCEHPDYDGLMAFYNGLNQLNDNAFFTGWADGAAGTNCEPCDWYGVTCNVDGRVTELTFVSVSLTGTLSPSIGDLTELKELNLPGNNITGSLPTSIKDLSKLEVLSLANNSLTGFSNQAANLDNLRLLLLQNNNFTTYFRTGILPALEVYDFSNNPNVGTNLFFFNVSPFTLPSLTYLDLSNCGFTGELPAQYGEWPVSQLTTLDFSDNNLEGCYPATFSTLCGGPVDFSGNPLLPEGGSDDFFDNTFCVTGETCPPCHPDFDALMAIYDASDGPNWSDDEGWVDGAAGTDCDVCAWEGVGCNAAGRVTSLYFFSSEFGGVLAPEVGDLTELRSLSLVFTDMSGALPAALGNLTNLRVLNLESTAFTGTLPASLGGLPNLKKLQCKFSTFSGPIPPFIGDITSLTELTLISNGFSGPIPEELGQLIQLDTFAVAQDLLTGTVPQAILDLPGLEQFNVLGNALTGGLPMLTDLSELLSYSIGNNNFTGTVPSDFLAGTSVERVYLLNNNFSGPLPSSFGDLSLLNLNLSGNNFTGCYPANYASFCGTTSAFFTNNPGLPDGGSLDFFQNTFCATGEGCEETCSPDFDALIAFYNATDGPNWDNNSGWSDGAAGTDCDVCDWQGVTCDADGRVIWIELANNGLGGSLPTEIGDLSKLQQLQIRNNDIGGTLPASLASLTELVLMYFEENQFTGAVPDLSGMTSLLEFSLNKNMLSGPFPLSLLGLPALERIDMDRNELTGQLPDFSVLPTLKTLHLTLSGLSGSLPFLNQPVNIESLRIPGNEFSGLYPTSWNATNLPIIRYLDVGNNNLEGPLPADIVNVSTLEQFFFNSNNFSGCYPNSYTVLCSGNIGFTFFNNFGLPNNGDADFLNNDFCVNGDACPGDCPPELYIFSNADVAAFQQFYPNCTDLAGVLVISGPEVTNTSGLSQLRSVGSSLRIEEVTTTTVLGLTNILSVGEFFIVKDCPNLGANGFGNDLDLQSIGEDLRLINLPLIEDFTPLRNVTSIGGEIIIRETSVPSLNGLQNVSGPLAGLTLEDNNLLTDLSALATGAGAPLTEIGFVVVSGNDALVNLNGFYGWAVPGELDIVDNSLLSDCTAEAVCQKIALNDNLVTIGGNTAGCNTVVEVESSCSSLPVTWLSFTATTDEKIVYLAWETADEEDNAGFTVERSDDGRRWTDIGEVPTTDTAVNGRHQYAFTDQSPPNGEVFYRIRQVDVDGTTTHSVVRRIVLEVLSAYVYPNPTNGDFTVVTEVPQAITIHAVDGRLVRTIVHLGGGAQVQREGLRSGVYWLRFEGTGEVVRVVVR